MNLQLTRQPQALQERGENKGCTWFALARLQVRTAPPPLWLRAAAYAGEVGVPGCFGGVDQACCRPVPEGPACWFEHRISVSEPPLPLPMWLLLMPLRGDGVRTCSCRWKWKGMRAQSEPDFLRLRGSNSHGEHAAKREASPEACTSSEGPALRMGRQPLRKAAPPAVQRRHRLTLLLLQVQAACPAPGRVLLPPAGQPATRAAAQGRAARPGQGREGVPGQAVRAPAVPPQHGQLLLLRPGPQDARACRGNHQQTPHLAYIEGSAGGYETPPDWSLPNLQCLAVHDDDTLTVLNGE